MKSETLAPGEYQLDREPDGTVHASDGSRTIVVAPGHDEAGHVFHRVAKRMGPKVTSGELPAETRVLVCELDGVRTYIDGDTFIITKQDLNF